MSSEGFFNAELKLRIISAIILGALVIWVTWIGGYTFELFWAVVGLLVFYEFTRITSTNISTLMRLVGMIMLLIVFAAWFSIDRATAYMMAAVSISTIATWEAVAKRSFWVSLAIAYAILPFFAMSEIRGISVIGLIAVAILFASVWGADIFAYVFGRLIGGPKLAPKISPKKTWAGFLGSLFGALLLSFFVVYATGKEANSGFWFCIIIVAIISQAGDLVISVIKRKFDVKDTGKIIPGHGGVLDRIDGLIPAGVVLWIILKLKAVKLNLNHEIGAALFLL